MRRPQITPRFGHSSLSTRHSYNNRRQPESGGVPTPRYSQHVAAAAHSRATQRRSPPTNYQPRYKSKGPDMQRDDTCNFCGLNKHFERECDLRSMMDYMKDYEQRLLERRNRTLNGQIHNLEYPSEVFNQDPNNFKTASQVVDACLVELNTLETAQTTSSWYLDSGATHHESGDVTQSSPSLILS